MKCFIAILLMALVAIAMAVEDAPKDTKQPQIADAGRDKRGLAYNYSPYTYSPYAYGDYNLPYAYASPYVYNAYPYYRYNHYPHYHTPYLY